MIHFYLFSRYYVSFILSDIIEYSRNKYHCTFLKKYNTYDFFNWVAGRMHTGEYHQNMKACAMDYFK